MSDSDIKNTVAYRLGELTAKTEYLKGRVEQLEDSQRKLRKEFEDWLKKQR